MRVFQVSKVEESLTNRGRFWQALSEPHRRLVCFCRLTEVPDTKKKRAKPNQHQRGVFLFNDLLVITKAAGAAAGGGKRKTSQHQYRSRLSLSEVRVSVFSTTERPWGIQLQQRSGGFGGAGGGGGGGRILATFAARSQSDQQQFVADLQESVAETLEMEKAKMFLNDLQEFRRRGLFPSLPVNEESLMLAPESLC